MPVNSLSQAPASVAENAPAGANAPPAGTFAGRLGRSRAAYVLVSLVMLIPCYWQPRVFGADLSSRIYNAWLPHFIESGRAMGQFDVNQTTNLLFDAMLRGLFRVVGAELAQRFSVSIAVLVFVWGAFAFASTISRCRPWHLVPSIAMLAYGWVYHMGFFSFYLSLGLCFWALSLAWEPKPRRAPVVAALLVLAYLAHALPVSWTLSLLLYLAVARRMTPSRRAMVTAATLLLMVVLHAAAAGTMKTGWSVHQIAMTTGADQVWIFDSKYYVVLAGLLAVWGLLFLSLMRVAGKWSVVSGIPFQFCAVSAAGVFILPNTILIPGLNHTLVFIAERMSLGVGVCVCAMLGAARPRLVVRCLLVGVALVFFTFLYQDERAQNSFQDRMQDKVAQVAPAPSLVSQAGGGILIRGREASIP